MYKPHRVHCCAAVLPSVKFFKEEPSQVLLGAVGFRWKNAVGSTGVHFHAEERADVSACLAWVPWRLVLLAVAEVLFVVTGRLTWYVESINGLVKTEFEQ